jgi:hypothetical protein
VTPLPFANTVLLIEGEGAAGNTSFNDYSAASHGAAATHGNVVTSTSSPTPAVGTGTISFDRNGDWLEWADHSDWTLGTSDFTLAVFFSLKSAGLATAQTIISHYNPDITQRGWALNFNGAGHLAFAWSSDGTIGNTVNMSGAFSPTADVVYFALVTRSGAKFRLHLGPVSSQTAPMVASATSSVSIFDASVDLMVGRKASGVGIEYLNGNIHNLALAVGVAWQASDDAAVIPTTKFPTS